MQLTEYDARQKCSQPIVRLTTGDGIRPKTKVSQAIVRFQNTNRRITKCSSAVKEQLINITSATARFSIWLSQGF